MEKKVIRPNPLLTEAHEKFNFNDKVALHITRFLGSMGAVYGCILFIGFWMFVGYETYEDPYPFPLLLLIINMVTMILLPLIMVGQNLINHQSQIRANYAQDATLATYENILVVLECLERHDKELLYQTKILTTLLQTSEDKFKPFEEVYETSSCLNKGTRKATMHKKNFKDKVKPKEI